MHIHTHIPICLSCTVHIPPSLLALHVKLFVPPLEKGESVPPKTPYKGTLAVRDFPSYVLLFSSELEGKYAQINFEDLFSHYYKTDLLYTNLFFYD
jgi:hypothetical protein